MAESLAQNESLLDHLEIIYNEVAQKNTREFPEHLNNNGGIQYLHSGHANNMIMQAPPPAQAMNCTY
jgi:hypothetical protein